MCTISYQSLHYNLAENRTKFSFHNLRISMLCIDSISTSSGNTDFWLLSKPNHWVFTLFNSGSFCLTPYSLLSDLVGIKMNGNTTVDMLEVLCILEQTCSQNCCSLIWYQSSDVNVIGSHLFDAGDSWRLSGSSWHPMYSIYIYGQGQFCVLSIVEYLVVYTFFAIF